MAVTFDASGTSGTTQGGSSPLTWSHTNAASADWLLAAMVIDGTAATPANNAISAATYNSVSMGTALLNWQSGGSGQTAGYLAVFGLHNPATGAADTVSMTYTTGTADGCIGGSASAISGGGTLGTAVHADSNGSAVTSGSITVTGTTSGSLVYVFVTNGSGGTAFTTGTSRFTSLHSGTAAGGAWSINCATIAGTGGSVTVNWTQTSDFYAAIAVEVKPPAAAAAVYGAQRQPARPRVPQARAGGIYMGLAPAGSDTSFGTGRTGWNGGAQVRNPTPGPVFRQAVTPARARVPQVFSRGRCITGNPGAPVQNPVPPVTGPPFYPVRQAVRARLPQPPAGMGAARGRVSSSPGAPVANPVPGPVFKSKPAPVRYVLPPWRPRAGRIGSSPGARVANPLRGPPVYAPLGPSRARLPLQPLLRGRTASSPGAPVANPNAVAVSGALSGPVRASLPPNPRGRVRVTPLSSTPGTPPVHAGPPFFPAVQALRARPPLPQRGRVTSNPGGPVRNPSAGPVFTQAVRPAQPRIPQVFSKGRTSSSPGAPVRNPSAGPVFRQATSPARIRPALPPRGRTASNPGGPVRNPVPGTTGPVFYPRNTAKARQPLPRRGICRAIRFGPLPANPSQGPVFTQAASPARARLPLQPVLRGRVYSNPGGPVANPVPGGTGPVFRPAPPAKARQPLPRRGTCRTIRFGPLPANPGTGPVFTQAVRPAQARVPLPPRGRVYSNPGGPVANPVPGTQGPPFFPFRGPARIRPALPPRGRTAASPGAPVRNPSHGPAVTPPHGPVQARFPLPPRGRTSGNPGIPVAPPPVPAPLYPFRAPVRIRPALPPRGRTGSNPGIPVVPPPVPAPVYPLHGPVQARRPLPPRGRCITGNPGAPVRNPHAGPVFRQLNWPARTRIPQNAPRGRTAGNAGAPVSNPLLPLRFRTGTPYFQWATGTSVSQWATGTPVAG